MDVTAKAGSTIAFEKEGLVIESNGHVEIEQETGDTYPSPILNIPSELYESWVMSEMVYNITSYATAPVMTVTVFYDKRLTPLKGKYSRVFKREPDNTWSPIESTLDKDNKKHTFQVNQNGVYAVFYNEYAYSSFTEGLAKQYPSWSRINKTKKSVGQQFLNFFGLEYEEVVEWLQWISREKHIDTADVNAKDWVYIYHLPAVKREENIELFAMKDGMNVRVPIIENVRSFFYNEKNDGGIIDYEEGRFYSDYDYEELRGLRDDEKGKRLEFQTVKQRHHIWNTFDEFALLLNIQRRYLENNASLKERILDVFRFPANSSKIGLINGLGQELNLVANNHKDTLIQSIKWKDDSKSLVIKNSSRWKINPKTLRLDGRLLEEDEYDFADQIYIHIYPKYQGFEHEVSFIYGIELHELNDQTDEELQTEMFDPNGQASEKLEHWVSKIKKVAPSLWGDVAWDEGYWNQIENRIENLGYIPNQWDAPLSRWIGYTLDHRRREEKMWELRTDHIKKA